jgi:hypothetical protein
MLHFVNPWHNKVAYTFIVPRSISAFNLTNESLSGRNTLESKKKIATIGTKKGCLC